MGVHHHVRRCLLVAAAKIRGHPPSRVRPVRPPLEPLPLSLVRIGDDSDLTVSQPEQADAEHRLFLLLGHLVSVHEVHVVPLEG